MKKLKLFMLAFIVVICGGIVFSACEKEKAPEEPQVVAVESTINPQLTNGNSFNANSTLGSVPISPSVGDTPGSLVWKNPTLQILVGENEYEWVFNPEDSQRYKQATGTLTIIGLEVYELSIQIGTLSSTELGFVWSYGQNVGEPQLMGYTGPAHLMSVEWKYYDKNNQPLNTMPTEVGDYKLKAEVSIEGREDVVSPIINFSIIPTEITDLDLQIENWTFGETPNIPQVDTAYTDKVTFYYSNEINGNYSKIDLNDYSTYPTNAGKYYLKGVLVDNNLTGESTFEFKIEKASYQGLVEISLEDWVYNETNNDVVLTSATLNVDNLVKNVTYAKVGSEEYSSIVPTNSGSYVVKVVIDDSTDGNYKSTAFTTEFKITPANFTGQINEISSTTFNGTSLKPDVTIPSFDTDDYDLIWEFKTHEELEHEFILLDTFVNDFVKAGVYRVTAVAKGNYVGQTTATYTISKARFTEKPHDDITVIFSENLTVSSIPVASGWVWDNNNEMYNQALTEGENIRVAIYTENNYEPFKASVKIIVLPNPNVVSELEFISAMSKDGLTTININQDITLTEDIEIKKSIVIAEGKTLTVNNSVNVSINEVDIQGNFVNNGKVTLYTTNISDLSFNPVKIVLTENVENKTFTYSQDDITLEVDLNNKTLTNVNFVVNHNSISEKDLNITIKNGTISSNSNGIEINGQEKTIINLQNVVITSNDCALFVQGETQPKIFADNCSFIGLNGLYLRAGNLEITNCDVIGTGDINEYPTDLTATGYAIFINAIADVTLIVTGGSLTTDNNFTLVREYQTEITEVVIDITIEIDGVTTENVYCNREDVVLNVPEI